MSIQNNNRVVLSLGSNCGDKSANVDKAIEWLKSWLVTPEYSDIYATPDAHGGPRNYMNAVVAGTTTLSFENSEKRCKEYEQSCGRDSGARAIGNVPIDVDIVIWNSTIIRPKDFSRQHFRLGYAQLPKHPNHETQQYISLSDAVPDHDGVRDGIP